MEKVFFELDGFFDRNGCAPCAEALSAERLTYLERDRWPEFERELRLRRLRKTRFDVQSYLEGCRPWEWLVWRCRTWKEVERVLNRHKIYWERGRGKIVIDGMRIIRCA